MKYFCVAVSFLLCVGFLFSGCSNVKKGHTSSLTFDAADGDTISTENRLVRPTYAGDEGRVCAPNQPFACEGLAGSTLQLTVVSAKAYSTVDEAVFPSERFGDMAGEYKTDNNVKAPYVFITVQLHIEATKGSDVLGDGYYIDILRVVDLNQDQTDGNADIVMQHLGSLQYINTVGEGDVVLSHTEKDYNLIHLEEGRSGNLILGYFIDKESLQSEKLYFAAGLSKSDCLYVPLYDLLSPA